MSDALSGLACGMLAAAAAFGIAGQTRQGGAAWQRGARVAGLLGTAFLLAALVAPIARTASLLYFFNPAGRALTIATIGLTVAWLPRALPTSTGLWWTLGLAAALAGWAEFTSAYETALPLSAQVTLLPLLAACGLMVPMCGHAATALQKQAACPLQERVLKLSVAMAMVLVVLLVLSVQNFITVGSFWPETVEWKALAAAWLLSFATYLMQTRPAGAGLVILSALVLIILSLLPGVWG